MISGFILFFQKGTRTQSCVVPGSKFESVMSHQEKSDYDSLNTHPRKKTPRQR